MKIEHKQTKTTFSELMRGVLFRVIKDSQRKTYMKTSYSTAWCFDEDDYGQVVDVTIEVEILTGKLVLE